MSKINILDSTIYNRIAAGEVVERPASVVKELVENSLDAKAKNITIEIENGGINYIKVVDDGSGIEYEDLKKAFLPHATSKVSCLEDLDGINSFGFRGEALASIASVSKVKIRSNTKNQEMGGEIFCREGKISSLQNIATPVGTTVLVENLFFNTPARFKFLKTPKQEESLITNIVNRLMLANPDIFFKYVVDGKVVYNVKTPNLKDKIFAIYGKQILENLIEVNMKGNEYSISGYISKPTLCKANRTYQTLMINNRYVVNNLVGVAVSNAYENFLMKGRFPIYILNLKMNFNDVDVNVHPSKMEVKFKNTNQIYNLIYSTVLETLNNNNCTVNYENLFNDIKVEILDAKETAPQDNSTLQKVEGGFSFGSLSKLEEKLSQIKVAKPKYQNEEAISQLNSKSYNLTDTKTTLRTEEEMNNSLFQDNTFSTNPVTQQKKEQEKFAFDINYKIIGTLFNTYILLESDENFYMLDQHAGHERVLYDRFIDEFKRNKVVIQDLLIPYIFNVNELENNLVNTNLSVFKDLGFLIESFGINTYRISAVPAILDGIDLNEFVLESLKNLSKISNNNEIIKNYFATCACKAAVKGGQKLSEEEIKTLLNLIITNKTTLLCPHGRPVCLKLTKYEIEKMFKRIV